MKRKISIEAVLIFFIVLSIQLKYGQLIAVGLSLFLFILIIIKHLLREKTPIFYRYTPLFCFWIILIIYMTRPNFIFVNKNFVDLLWLLFGSLFLATVFFEVPLTSDTIRKTIFFASGIGGWVALGGHILGTTFYVLLSKPRGGVRVVGGFDGPNELGAYYLIIASLAIGAFLYDKTDKKLLIFTLSSSLPLVYLSMSRGALIGLFLLFCYFCGILVYRSRKKMKYLLLIMLSVLLIAVITSRFLLPNLYDVRKKAQPRYVEFEDSFQQFIESPIFGKGIGSFSYFATGKSKVPHNEFLYFLTAGGIIGCMGLIIFFLYIMKLSFKSKLYPEIIAILIFLTQELLFNHLSRGRISFIFWIIVMSILIYYRKNYEKKQGEVRINQPAKFVLVNDKN